MNEKVSDHVISNDWDLQKLSFVLHWYVVHRIFSIHIGNNHGIVDSAIWGISKNGNFSVSSAYKSQFNGSDFDIWQWNFIWCLNLPPRVLYFLWTLLHGKILTNEQRVVKGLNSNTICERCKVDSEDMDHVFRGYRTACEIWEDICKGVTLSNAYKIDWNEWLYENFKCSRAWHGTPNGHGMPGPACFGTQARQAMPKQAGPAQTYTFSSMHQSNRVADSLANLGHSLILGITVFKDPPLQIFDIMDDDCNGVTTARMFPCSPVPSFVSVWAA
ncbi:hypothetical protein Ddye_025668 [Dipteronia dyeriana]|uniref:Reverse transcriptase zinc-binding domain-containing protein n=1 Tax=Dipteronia dyeriana TaxID=168575 RepID=A0AAD9TL82_9ROSI|nr:hypothetical protein Ddye_025668 [Dipteronia dyeriana]